MVDASIPVEAAPEEKVDEVVETHRPWITIVWNDPINLMSYVTYVFMTYFHFSREKAEKLRSEKASHKQLLEQLEEQAGRLRKKLSSAQQMAMDQAEQGARGWP